MDFLASTYLDEFFVVMLLQTIAVVSPGPDFAIVVENSLLHSRRVGVYTAVGIAVGILAHVLLAVLGIGFVLTQSIWLFTGFKILACAYLIYMSYRSFRAGNTTGSAPNIPATRKSISPQKAFLLGVVTNVMNPKCILFMLTLFTVVVSPSTPRLILSAYGGVIFLITLAWFLIVSLCFSIARVQRIFTTLSHWITRFTGAIFLLLAVKLIFDLYTS